MLLAASVHWLSGCTPHTAPHVAERHRLSRTVEKGAFYNHVVYTQSGASDDDRFYLYFEGDGRPWIDGRKPATDPSPSNALGLRLMVTTDDNASYIGRPCYEGQHRESGCTPDLWTHRRYSPSVIDSMAEVAEHLIRGSDASSVILVGYSGGGVIATLLAPRLSRVTKLITVASNLDLDAWTNHHGYEPLTGSMDPADLQAWPPGLLALHLVGGQDSVVPPTLTEGIVARYPEWETIRFEKFDHRCCWISAWPDIIQELESR